MVDTGTNLVRVAGGISFFLKLVAHLVRSLIYESSILFRVPDKAALKCLAQVISVHILVDSFSSLSTVVIVVLTLLLLF